MTALPITLEDALRDQGFTIDVAEVDAFDITITEGVIHIPAAVRTELTWRRTDPPTPELGADFYLSNLPIFDPAYLPVILSNILDRYRTRRLGYNTPGEWMLAFRRWGNLNMTIPNQRYRSTAVALPLDDRDATDTTAATNHALDVGSDFPQSLISGAADYASAATDRRSADNATIHRTGRMASIMTLITEQRAAYLNVDAEVLDGLDRLFFSPLDRGEGLLGMQYGYPSHYPTHLAW